MYKTCAYIILIIGTSLSKLHTSENTLCTLVYVGNQTISLLRLAPTLCICLVVGNGCTKYHVRWTNQNKLLLIVELIRIVLLYFHIGQSLKEVSSIRKLQW